MQENKFNHPYDTPYQVQIDLMQEIYNLLLSDRKLGIFESPTGTGKTLSLICSTMTWLREYKRRVNDGVIAEKLKDNENDTDNDDDDDDEPDWVRHAFRDKIMAEFLGEAIRYEQHLDEIKNQGAAVVEQKKSSKVKILKRRKNNSAVVNEAVDIDSLAPDDFDIKSESISSNGFSKDVEKLLTQVEGKSYSHSTVHSTKINESITKIFFVSRTHSQLSQFSSQLKMASFPSSITNLDSERVKYLPLGSRKQLCINKTVYSLNDSQAINKACQNLQKEPNRCSYLPQLNNPEDQSRKEYMNDLIMSDIYDIEDLHSLGEQLHLCPYYTTKNDLPIAEIVSMPYQMLLQKVTRSVLGIDLKNSVVVIDEAHNLLDTISQIYSSSISLTQVSIIRKALKSYTKKFLCKMSAGNRINISKLSKLVSIIYKFLSNPSPNKKSGTTIERNDIFNDEITSLLNVYDLENYLIQSKLPFKLESYIEKTQEYTSTGQPLLFTLKSFLYSLSNPLKTGKFFWDISNNETSIKYLLLDPSEDFRDIVEESKCVILAGGTMEPVSEFTDFLVPYLKNDQITQFSCDHVIPDSNLYVFPVASYKNLPFQFSFQKRNDVHMINNLGEYLCELLKEIPCGAVAFFPSYNYLSEIVRTWKNSGMYNHINNIKKIFMESKETSVDKILQEYRTHIQLESQGALLLSVVGGKMSEGINFNDELARAVFMVGLPYPNAFSSEIIAKREYIESKYLLKGATNSLATTKSQEFYENLCMKAVNQSVGRAIRSINDYATIYLVDTRYKDDRIQGKLSKWVRKRLAEPRSMAEDSRKIVIETRRFFDSKKIYCT